MRLIHDLVVISFVVHTEERTSSSLSFAEALEVLSLIVLVVAKTKIPMLKVLIVVTIILMLKLISFCVST